MLKSVRDNDDLLCLSGSQPLLSGHSHNVLQGGGLVAGSSKQEVGGVGDQMGSCDLQILCSEVQRVIATRN